MRENLLLFPLIVTFFYCAPASAGALEEVEQAYLPAVVKLEVTYKEPVFKKNKDGVDENVCTQEEGTGFYINKNTVVTATHVIRKPDECEISSIEVVSNKYKFRKIANILYDKNDIALLSTDSIENIDGMCSLPIHNEDVTYKNDVIRFGVRAKSYDVMAKPVDIKGISSDNPPYASIVPIETFLGESGGPIVLNFNVIGLLEKRYADAHSVALMIRGKFLQESIAENKLKYDNTTCNAATRSRFIIKDASAAKIDIIPKTQQIIIQRGGGGVLGNLWGSKITSLNVPLPNPANIDISGVACQAMFKNNLNCGISTLSGVDGGVSIKIGERGDETVEVNKKMDQAYQGITDAYISTLWLKYLGELKKSNPPPR